MRTILGLVIGGGLGALLGYSKLLCLTGECAITGSWQGGAIAGGVVGLVLMTGLAPGTRRPSTLRQDPAEFGDEPERESDNR